MQLATRLGGSPTGADLSSRGIELELQIVTVGLERHRYRNELPLRVGLVSEDEHVTGQG